MLGAEDEFEDCLPAGGLHERWESWLKKFEDGQLNCSDFRSFWAITVPELFSLSTASSCLNPKFDEGHINYVLLASLEKFVTGAPDPKHVIKALQQKQSPPSFCGHVFKFGEPAYSCRDCGSDPTCVMCALCFKSSEHGQHKYKMNISRGGGYCDCGDQEAWKKGYVCSSHDKESKDDEDIVPQDMQARLRLVVESALIYAYQLLLWNKYTELPTDLDVVKKRELYITMLFNDESHTYEQVISSLSRAIEVDEREAVDFAATVDREGRAMVKIDGYTECCQVKASVERITSRNGSKPLILAVMTCPLVSHQIFAGRVIQWIDAFCKKLRGFTKILGDVLLTVPTSPIEIYPLVRSVMRYDVKLWKSARQLWHQLIINGILMNNATKLQLAKMFARDYPDLVKDFIIDDHSHTMSILNLSVQLFSVISVAHTLIAEDNVLSALMRTFLSECMGHKNPGTGKLAFDRAHTGNSFRRCQFVLTDLKFLLYVKPSLPWSEELRKSFSSGLENVLVLLSDMQCMDSVVRQVGQHVEFEAEWETGVNIQLKLSPVISILLEWCEMDKDVLIRAIRKTLDHLTKADKSCSADVTYISRHLTGIYDEEVRCIDYDVSLQPITVHLPLSRFLSGLLLSTSKFDLDFNSHQLEIQDKPTLIQVMEQPLRLQVMVAQFRAGMWRRNGYSLLNQVFFYTNFRIRAETFDRDIALLQYCAAKLNPNELLIHILNKFDLLTWSTNLEFARTTAEGSPDMSTLGDDLLSLILYLVAERHEPGIGQVTEVDRVKKEVIQLLCIESLPHSKLVKQLPAKYDESAMEIMLEEVLGEVAIFERPASVGAVGKYKLKDEYYQFFNPFFYHYSREEQSKAEEVQLKRRKTANLPGFCPPPVLPHFTPEYQPILNILDCNVFGHLVNTILERCIKGSTLHSDAQLERVLHLVGVGLNEFQRGCMTQTFMERMQSMRENFEAASTKLDDTGSLAALMNFIIRKINCPSSGGEELIPERIDPDAVTGRNKRSRNAELAAARRAKIMAQMSAQQNNFSKENAHMFDDDDIGEEDGEHIEDLPKFICILCREEEVVSFQAKKSLVVSAFVQKSAVLRNCDNNDPATRSVLQGTPLLMGLPPSDLSHGSHISTCGHVMHSECWEAFYELVQAKESRRPNRYGRHVSFDVAQNEFLCPLCECLSNTVIPIVPNMKDDTKPMVPERNLTDWLDSFRTIADTAVPVADKMPSKRSRTKSWTTPVPVTHEDPREFPPKTDKMLKIFISSIEPEKNGEEEEDVVLAVTYALSYTIQATEWCIRAEDKTLLADISSRKLYCLENMIKATRASQLLSILKPSAVTSDAIQVLRRILLPQTEVDFCILEIDPFGLLCLLHFSLPSISDYDSFSLSKNLLSLVTAMHLVQIVISLYLRMDKSREVKMSEETSSSPLIDVDRVNKFASEVLLAAGLSADSRFPPASRVIEALVPFLRATAIFQYFVSPKDCDIRMRNNHLNDASSVCHFIGLTSERLNTILECRPLRELALAWARQPKVLHLATSHWKPIYPLKITSLINLPQDYSEIINSVSMVNCPSSAGEVNILADEVRTPSMCLVCGAVLCSQSYCCQTMWGSRRVGACVAHAKTCSAGIGVFLRIKDCRVMLLVGATKGKYSSPPYVDEYGETDPGLMRGNPLTLCTSAYTQLNQLWLSHGIPEQVAHALETSTSLSSTNWALM